MALTKVTGGLLGNLPTGTGNVAVGDTALDSIASGAKDNVAIGSAAGTALTTAIRTLSLEHLQEMRLLPQITTLRLVIKHLVPTPLGQKLLP